MSVKSKNTSMEKLIAHFSKMDIDEKIKAFGELRGILNAEILKHSQDLENQAQQYQNIHKEINK